MLYVAYTLLPQQPEKGYIMNHIEGSFKGVRNANIYYQAWLPEGDIEAVLLVVHGLG